MARNRFPPTTGEVAHFQFQRGTFDFPHVWVARMARGKGSRQKGPLAWWFSQCHFHTLARCKICPAVSQSTPIKTNTTKAHAILSGIRLWTWTYWQPLIFSDQISRAFEPPQPCTSWASGGGKRPRSHSIVCSSGVLENDDCNILGRSQSSWKTGGLNIAHLLVIVIFHSQPSIFGLRNTDIVQPRHLPTARSRDLCGRSKQGKPADRIERSKQGKPADRIDGTNR